MKTTDELQGIARQIRRHIVTMTAEAASGHPGGSLSAVEMVTSLYFGILKHDSSNPSWPNRDRFILSKAHACPVLYAALALSGYFPESELATYRKINSRLQGHAHIKTPGVEMSGGSLGQGLSFGVGISLAARLDKRPSHTYVLLGDGECDEGQIWEAAMSASHFKLDNLVALVDRNNIQNDRWTHEVMELEPLPDKWRAFGFAVKEVDGHSVEQIQNALATLPFEEGKPNVLICHTLKGKGVPFAEGNMEWHHKNRVTDDEIRSLLEALEAD